MENPRLYLEAWIKQTDGFWNLFIYESAREWDGPADYSMLLPIEIKGKIISGSLQNLRVEWEYLSKTIWGIRVFPSIGFCAWINIMLFFLFIATKSSYTIFPAFNLANLITLLLSSPLNNCERYYYSMYITTGFLVLIALNSIKKKAEMGTLMNGKDDSR